MLKNLLLIILAGICSSSAEAQQDTMRYRHAFRLPTGNNQNGYEKKISQYASNIHSFIFSVPDSCTVYIVVRSENDSLDILLDNREVMDIASKKEGKYVYPFARQLTPGEHKFVIRTRKYCSYSVFVKGQL
jgi:hypothetical protein